MALLLRQLTVPRLDLRSDPIRRATLTDLCSVRGLWPDQCSSNLGPSFTLAWPVDPVVRFGDLLLAVDDAASQIENVLHVATTSASNSGRPLSPSAAIVRYATRRS